MNLSNYISELLFRYDCVIVPDFGGFLTKKISAKINYHTHEFSPPSKELSFNSRLQNNDGLLANHISNHMDISYDKAVEMIKQQVEIWYDHLEKNKLTLENIGVISLTNEKKLSFQPSNDVNYLQDSFGMNSITSPAIKRVYQKEIQEEQKPVSTDNEVVVIPKQNKKSSTKKYAIAAIFVIGFLGAGSTYYYNQQQNQQQIAFEKEEVATQKKMEQKIQEATFAIEPVLETVEIVKTPIKTLPYKYHIIAGAFKNESNAQNKVNELKHKGYKASIIGKNKWKLYQVAYVSFHERKDADKSLKQIKENESSDSWLLIDDAI